MVKARRIRDPEFPAEFLGILSKVFGFDKYSAIPQDVDIWGNSIKLDINSIFLFIPLATFRRSKPIFIGEIVHELAHIYAGHLSLILENLTKYEKEADKIAEAWGFKKEIRVMNKEIRSIKALGLKDKTHKSGKNVVKLKMV